MDRCIAANVTASGGFRLTWPQAFSVHTAGWNLCADSAGHVRGWDLYSVCCAHGSHRRLLVLRYVLKRAPGTLESLGPLCSWSLSTCRAKGLPFPGQPLACPRAGPRLCHPQLIVA